MAHFQCTKCNRIHLVQTSGGTGYGVYKQNEKVCYSCCAKLELADMLLTGKATLYFCKDKVTDWAGKLAFKVLEQRKSNHNMARIRYDYWFLVANKVWHGYTIGDNTQIAHCKQTSLTYTQWANS